MAVISTAHELKVQVPPKRIFRAMVIDGHKMLPKMASRAIKSIDLLEGDGGARSIWQINLPDGAPFPYIREKIDVVDMENLVFKVIVFESPMFGQKLEAIHSTHKYEDSGDGGCLVKVTVESHAKDDAYFSEEDSNMVGVFGREIIRLVEEYLIANPDVCA